MEITIQSLHFDASEALKDFVTEKVSKLSTLYNKIESADVTLKLENAAQADNKICEIRLAVPGSDLFAKRQHQSFEEATNEVVDVLQQQIHKMKGKQEGN